MVAVSRARHAADDAVGTRIAGPAAVPALRAVPDPTRHGPEHTARHGQAALWPPERDAAVRLARAHQTLDRLDRAADPRLRALGHRQVDAAETAARALLDRPADTLTGAAERDQADMRAAQERGRTALTRMLGSDPVAHAAAMTDVTRTWPAEHLAVLRQWADHAHHQHRPNRSNTDSRNAGEQDAVATARAAVDAVPTAQQLADIDDTADDVLAAGPSRFDEPDGNDDAMTDTTGGRLW